MEDIKVMIATAEYAGYAEAVSEAIAEASLDKNSGLAHRTPEFIRSKIEDGSGVIALEGKNLAGFCYIKAWEHGLFVAHSGLIVKPEHRGRGLAKALKMKAFELTAQRYPEALIFGLTTSPAVRKINESLGYKTVPYINITSDINFWKGCTTCVHYGTLCRNGFESCLCTAMVYDPKQH